MGSPLGVENYFLFVGCRKPKKVGKHCYNSFVDGRALPSFSAHSVQFYFSAEAEQVW